MPRSIVVPPMMVAMLGASSLALSPVAAVCWAQAAQSVRPAERSDAGGDGSRISPQLNGGYLLAQVPQPRSRPAAETNRSSAPGSLDDLKQRDKELEKLRTEQRRTLENEAKLKREIEQIGDDRRKFNQQIIDTAARVTAVEERIEQTQARLQPLEDSEQALRLSLQQRHNAIAEVLAALQRIGRQAPPALLVPAEDALQSVRSAMLLGAVVPEMRQQAEALTVDLAELVRLRKDIAAERDKLARDLFVLADERQRLSAYIEERQKRQTDTEQALSGERQRAQQLARQAENLNQLINQIEQNLDSAARSTRMTERGSGERKALDIRPDLAAFRDPGRIAPAVSFASAKGMLPLPVKGMRIKEFGAADGLGGTAKGLSIAARPGVQITAPCDGWVVYAGNFRNYGQLLILNVGGGYHVLLAGMERISVDLGQFVVTGEPVAAMGSEASSPVPVAGGSTQPVLYVEFRKDGVPVDPGPWWAGTEAQKVRG
jgi:septal ring factor EnvC (AmiA/AmiB activator)